MVYGNGDYGDEYDERLVAVTEALEEVERPGDCFTCGVHARFPLPALVVNGWDEVRLPLGDTQAKALIEKCHLVPYGKGEDTLADTQVRNTWELNADQFELRNEEWEDMVDAIVESVRVPLGINETTEIEAKLYKMLLYEAGGKFGKHQDSEKENGMFGTLIVILPCDFQGGELIVNHPASVKKEAHVWDPAGMNRCDLKYAAFYGDCEHEVKPVTEGYRLCLTYNLVATTSDDLPQFVGNHALYQRLDDTLRAYFLDSAANKRQKVSAGASVVRTRNNDDQRDCQLVYAFEHKYTNAGLSFAHLKNKDLLIAQSLAKFCEDHHGAYSLYLCKIHYTYEYDPDCSDDETSEKTVTLESPWIKYGEYATIPCSSMAASISGEIAPAGFFEEVPLDGSENHGYTRNAGNRMENWYTSASLVLQPVKIELEQLARAGMDYAVKKWVKLVEIGSPHAEAFCSTLFSSPRRWTSADASFVACLKAVRRLGSVDILSDVLHSVSTIKFQPALADTLDHFGWTKCIDLIIDLAEAVSLRSRVNLACSILHGVSEVEKISQVFKVMDLQPQVVQRDQYSYCPNDNAYPSIEEYSRLLGIAYTASVGNVQTLVETEHTSLLIKLTTPALAAFVRSLGESQRPPELLTLVRTLRESLRNRMPPPSTWDLSHLRLHGGGSCCGQCTQLQMFLSSRTQQTLRMPMKKSDRHHIHSVIESYCRGRLSHATERPNMLVINKLLPAVQLHDLAQQTLQRLRAISGDEYAADAPEKDSTAIPSNEVIEIDSD